MSLKTITSVLALAAGVSQVAAQICANPIVSTEAGFHFHLVDDSIAANNNVNIKLRKSKTGPFSYVAIDKSSPDLLANFDNGSLFAVNKDLSPTGQTAYLTDFKVDLSGNPPSTSGKIAFANGADVANATDVNWILTAADPDNNFNLWRQEPVNTLSGVQICEADFDLNADGSPWYYFQYDDWRTVIPSPNCEFVAFLAHLAPADMPQC